MNYLLIVTLFQTNILYPIALSEMKNRAKIHFFYHICKFFVAFFSSFCKIAGFWMFLHQFCELCSELCSEFCEW